MFTLKLLLLLLYGITLGVSFSITDWQFWSLLVLLLGINLVTMLEDLK